MVICFHCSHATKLQLDGMVASGDYANYGEAISAAVSNQSVLHEKVASVGSVVMSDDNAAVEAGQSEGTRNLFLVPRPRVFPLGKPMETPKFGVPELFALSHVDEPSVELADPPVDEWGSSSDVPPDRWLWGQHNRFLPAKASCRALANLQIDSPRGVLLSASSDQIVKGASELGDYLGEYDRRFDLKRDEAAAIAFPHSGPNLWKAQQRFRSQFVGNLNSQGVVSGMLLDLKLVNWTPAKGDVKLRLTSAGWAFSRIPNLMLDGDASNRSLRLSDEEVNFLLTHIRQSVRAENFAYLLLLGAIARGDDTPDTLDGVVKAFSLKVSSHMSPAFVSTQRSGAIARMSDLGLVARVRSGLSVRYAITSRGRAYLHQQN